MRPARRIAAPISVPDVALAGLAPIEAAGGRQKTNGEKKTERIKKRLFGYDASLVVARDPERHGAPLPDGSASPDVIPALIVAFSVDKPSHRPGQVAVEAPQHVDNRFPRGYLAGDRPGSTPSAPGRTTCSCPSNAPTPKVTAA
ncbi:hypothetical protein ACFYOV_06010 [Streptomyces sp. NPDC005931]|uniref:hypothetical protein n=1 Tax=Streptomyces sp. NPDC005931 TaxID=3364737 RepID=UPI003683519A